MMLYLDTSALVKLYVSEEGFAWVRAWVEEADLVMTAAVTYAEARATFARLHRVGALSASALRRVTAELDVSWSGYTLVDVCHSLVVRAGTLAERHALRGYDAIQLAAALEGRPDRGEYRFGSFDSRLNAAAEREDLSLAETETLRERAASVYGTRSFARRRPQVAASGRSR